MSLFDKLDRTILRNMHIDHESVNKSPDSLEIGTPGRGGVIKVYGDYSNPEQFKAKLDQAIQLKAYANTKLYGTTTNDKPTINGDDQS